jgi:salicylate hydroxylase
MVLLVPDDIPPNLSSTLAASVTEMRSLFTTWDPRIPKLLNLCTSVSKWRLCIRQPLQTWSASSGTFTLLGDAAHATLPYLASGAGMALEDAAVLGECLSRIEGEGRDEKRMALGVYEACRKERTERVVEMGNRQQVLYHLTDGDEQVERDEGMREEREGEALAWRDVGLAGWLLGYDHLRDVDEKWIEAEAVEENMSVELRL